MMALIVSGSCTAGRARPARVALLHPVARRRRRRRRRRPGFAPGERIILLKNSPRRKYGLYSKIMALITSDLCRQSTPEGKRSPKPDDAPGGTLVSAPQSTRQTWTVLQHDGPGHLGCG